MKTTRKIISGAVFFTAIIALLSFDLPNGWFKAGSQPQHYDMGVEKGAGLDGKNAATIKSTKKRINGFGTLMQNCLPDKYLGERVRMTAMVKTKDVTTWAGIWMRVDEQVAKTNISFDNLKDGKEDRSIKGTTNWKKYEIVLDVPFEATNIAYGALLVGTGQVWFDDVKFEIIDKNVPTTGKDGKNQTLYKQPVNLDFEE